MNFNIAQIESFANNLKLSKVLDSPGGIASNFVSIDDKLGIKTFFDEESRDFACDKQDEASQYELAPEVYDSIYLPQIDRYGYVTEKVDVMPDIIQREWNGEKFEIEGCDHAILFTHSEAMKTLIRGLVELDIFFCDNHAQNIGLKNGRLVCIDFGREGMVSDFEEFREILEHDKEYLLSCIEHLL